MSSDTDLVLKDYSNGIGERTLQQYRASEEKMPILESSAYDASQWKGQIPILDRWHTVVEKASRMTAEEFKADGDRFRSGDETSVAGQMMSLLDENVKFHPPTYWKSRNGQMMGGLILKEVCQIFGKSFKYHRQLVDASKTNVVMEFSAMVEEIPCQGVDIVQLSDDRSKVVDFKVMVRPPEAALRLKKLMAMRVNAILREMGIEIGGGAGGGKAAERQSAKL